MASLEKTENTTVPFIGALGQLREQTSNELTNVETRVALFGRRAQVKFLKSFNEARKQIHRYPITSVFVGVGAGLLLKSLTTFVSMRKDPNLSKL